MGHGGSIAANYDQSGAINSGSTGTPNATQGQEIQPVTTSQAALQTVGAQSAWPTLSPGTANTDFGVSAVGPALKAGTGKGQTDPNLALAASYMKLAGALANGNVGAIRAAANELPTADLAKIGSGDFVNFIAGGMDINDAAGSVGTGVSAQKELLTAAQSAYDTMVKSFTKAGFAPTTLQRQTPTSLGDVHDQLHYIASMPLPSLMMSKLTTQGYNTTGLNDIGDLVPVAHDLQTGSPGASGGYSGPGKPITGATFYKSAMEAYNGGGSGQSDLVANLQALGYLDISGSQPTDQDVGQGIIKLINATSKYNETSSDQLTPDQYTAKVLTNPSQFGLAALPDQSVDYEYVEKIAQNIGVPLSQAQIVGIANVYATAPAGTDAEATVSNMVTQEAQENLTHNPQTQIIGGSMATTIQENLRAAYAAEGVGLTSGELAAQTSATLQGDNTSSIYAAGDAATAQGQKAARAAATNLYQNLAPQIAQDTSVQSLAAPYLATAANTLGVSAADMSIADPQWMKWESGGPGGKMMSQSQWAQTLMTDPQYGFSKSQPEANAQQSAASGILGMLNMVPTSASMPSAASSSSFTSTQG